MIRKHPGTIPLFPILGINFDSKLPISQGIPLIQGVLFPWGDGFETNSKTTIRDAQWGGLFRVDRLSLRNDRDQIEMGPLE